jgi:hemin uptake protein HemP
MTENEKPERPMEVRTPQKGSQGPLCRWSVKDLMGSEREAIIEHSGQEYRLRLTAAGKLILTK